MVDPGESAIPVADMVENIVGCKWSVQLLQRCVEGHHRPSAFLRECPGLSAKVLNERLRKMMRFGILDRTVRGQKPPVEVEYRLTPFGVQFIRILDEVQRLQRAVDDGRVAFGPPNPRTSGPPNRRTSRPSDPRT
jgi:DNA-binding HxlR family transcriptional regulator